jgi:nitronate monooxygenase
MNTALTNLLGIEHPIVQGPFGGGLSTAALTVAVSNAGGLGSFGAHNLQPDQITALVKELKQATDRPFAVNLWVPQPAEKEVPRHGDALAEHIARLRPHYDALGVPPPDPSVPFSYPDFDAQVDAALDAAPPVLSFVMGVPPERVVTAARQRGTRTIGTATTAEEAVALEAAGLDAVVASGSDAGGHRGAFLRPVEDSLVGTFSLVPQVADAVSVPVIAAGGIADGRGIVAALALGAAGVQIGTGFLATRESNASAPHRAALRSPDARVTVLTRLFSGRLARAIKNGFIRDMAHAERDVPGYPLQNSLMLPIRRAAAERGQGDRLNLWSGQAAPLLSTHERGAADYLAELVRQSREADARRAG